MSSLQDEQRSSIGAAALNNSRLLSPITPPPLPLSISQFCFLVNFKGIWKVGKCKCTGFLCSEFKTTPKGYSISLEISMRIGMYVGRTVYKLYIHVVQYYWRNCGIMLLCFRGLYSLALGFGETPPHLLFIDFFFSFFRVCARAQREECSFIKPLTVRIEKVFGGFCVIDTCLNISNNFFSLYLLYFNGILYDDIQIY